MNSKRLQALNNMEATLISRRTNPQERYAKAWTDYVEYFNEEDGVDDIKQIYIFQAGFEMMPADYKQEFDTIEELEAEMRSFNQDFRKWQYDTNW